MHGFVLVPPFEIKEMVPNGMIFWNSMTTYTGCMIVGWLKVLKTIWACTASATLCYAANLKTEQTKRCTAFQALAALIWEEDNPVTVCTRKDKDYMLAILGATLFLVHTIMYFVQAACLFYGTTQERPEYLKPFVIAECVNVIAMFVYMLSSIIVHTPAVPGFGGATCQAIFAVFVVTRHLAYLYDQQKKKA